MFAYALRQTATYWGNPQTDGFGGYTFAAPVQILCKWENRFETLSLPDGVSRMSNAKVWVGQPVDLGGYLFLGVSAEPDPTRLDGLAFKILQIRETPDIRNLMTERVAFLGTYRG